MNLPTQRGKYIDPSQGWSIFREEASHTVFFEIYYNAIKSAAAAQNCLTLDRNESLPAALSALRIVACLFRIKLRFFVKDHLYIAHIEALVKGLRDLISSKIVYCLYLSIDCP